MSIREAREARHAADVEAQVELLQVVRSLATEWGSLAQFFKAPPPSGVLFSGSYALNTNGHRPLSFPVPFAAVMVVNLGSTTMTIAGGGVQEHAPTAGPGVVHVPAGAYRVVNMANREFVLYGQPGAVADVTVFERPQQESAGAASLLEPPATFADSTGDVAVTNAAPVQLLAADVTRRAAQITNTGANPMRVGSSTVAVNGGILRLVSGQTVTLTTTQALYAIAESAATTAMASAAT